MGSDLRIELNSGGAREILASPAVQAMLMEHAQAIAARANAQASPDPMTNLPYMAVDSSGKRARARVITANPHGQRAPNRILNNLR